MFALFLAEGMSNFNQVPHSAPNGALAKYQERITHKYLAEVENLKQNATLLAQDCQKQLSILFSDFKKYEGEQKEKMSVIISSMGTTQVPFEDLSQQISDIGDNIIQKSHELQTKSLDLYEQTFSQLQPIIDKAYDDCKDIIPQIEPQYSHSMEFAVTQLNEQFLKNKSKMIELLNTFITEAETIKSSSGNEFVQRTDDWKTNRFETIINTAKEKLDPLKQLEYGTIFDDFYKEQIKFTRCFKKSIQSYSVIIPPNHFDENELEEWWKQVDETLKAHANFIDIYVAKVTDHLNAKAIANANILQKVEEQITDLKDENEINAALAELTPLQRHGQKLNQVFIEKLTKYFDYKKNNLRKIFETMHNFLLPIVQRYNKLIEETNESVQGAEDLVVEERKNSETTLTTLEANLNEKEAEIQILANEKDINQRISQCKLILEKIEKEYRSFYEKVVAIYNFQPEISKNIFDEGELDLMNLLKLRKIASAPEFEHISRSSSSSKSRISLMRKQPIRPKKLPKGMQKQIDFFNFSVKNGAKFEELEQIKVIPEFEEFTDEPTTITNKKGNKGRPFPKKPPKIPKPNAKTMKGKKINDDIDDIDIPEFNFISSIPRFDNKLAIDIYIPINDELDSWVNELRVGVISTINDMFGVIIQKVQFKEERNELANELNERMRVHAPRLNSLEINVAKTRVLLIESRKTQLEKHFHHGATTFNKGLLIIENDIEKYKENMMTAIQELVPFIQKIGEIKSIPQFVVLEQNFKYTEKTFLSKYDDAKKKLNDGIETFVKSFQATNERFIDAVISKDASFSQDEKDVAMQYFDRMQKQVNDIVNAIKEKVTQASIEIDNKYQSVADEFQTLIPRNKADVTFIDTLASQQHQAQIKFDTLLFRNKQQEQELDDLIVQLEEIIKKEGDPQQIIINDFDTLERLRVAIIKRTKYLGILKSEITYDPIAYNLDLLSPVQGFEHDGANVSSIDKRKNKIRNKSLPSKAKISQLQKKPVEQEVLATMRGQIDQIGNILIQFATKTATDYFANLKSTKSTIIRTKDIPPNPNECIEKVRSQWASQIVGTEDIFAHSSLKLRSQISRAISITRDVTTSIFTNYSQFYLDRSLLHRQEAQQILEDKLQKLKIQREINKAMLSPKIADANNISSLNSLVQKELSRQNEEFGLIQDFEVNIIEGERSVMNLFTTHLPLITNSLISLYDKFPLFEDLVEGPIENEPRKTLREMLKAKERNASTQPEDPDRPFHVRPWPTLPYIMEPMISIPPPVVEKSSPSSTARSSAASSSKKKSKRKEKEQQKTIEIETMPVISTLDTQLHRAVIVDRNKAFDAYQESLKVRLNDFREFIDNLKNESKKFSQFWTTSIKSLSPKYVFPKTTK